MRYNRTEIERDLRDRVSSKSIVWLREDWLEQHAEIERMQGIIDAAIGALNEHAILSASLLLSRAAHGARLSS